MTTKTPDKTTKLGYDAGLGYELAHFDDAELEQTYQQVVAEQGYVPHARADVVFAGFALPKAPTEGPTTAQ